MKEGFVHPRVSQDIVALWAPVKLSLLIHVDHITSLNTSVKIRCFQHSNGATTEVLQRPRC